MGPSLHLSVSLMYILHSRDMCVACVRARL
jgi:hypothetical protein